MYTPLDVATFSSMDIAVRIVGERAAAESMLIAQVHSLDPKVVVRLTPYADMLDSQIALPRFQTLLFSVFGSLGLLLAAVGIFGVVGYVVSRRTHEIGVRMALGADAHDVRTMVIWQALTPVVIGLGLGLVGAFWATRLLTSWLFEVTPHDPLTLTMVSCLLLATALGATYLPARRASRVDPMEALRAE
jgi:putative ABC transport system permease protein